MTDPCSVCGDGGQEFCERHGPKKPDERTCRYCKRPHPVSDWVYEESPFCAGCLNERVAEAQKRADPKTDERDEEMAKEWLTGLGHFKIRDIARLTALIRRAKEERDAEWVRAVREICVRSEEQEREYRVNRPPWYRDEILKRMGVEP